MSFPPEAAWGGPRVLCETRSPSPQYACCNARVLGSRNVIITEAEAFSSVLISSVFISTVLYLRSLRSAASIALISDVIPAVVCHDLYSRLSGGAYTTCPTLARVERTSTHQYTLIYRMSSISVC